MLSCCKFTRCAYRHGHFSNAIEQDDQQPEEGEAGDLLSIIGADRMHMGAQEQSRSDEAHDQDLERLGLVYYDGPLDESELPLHQSFPPLQTCRCSQRL